MCGSLAPSWPCLSFSISFSSHSTAPTDDNNNDGAQSKQQQQWTGNIWASLDVFNNNNNDDDTKLTESMSPWSLRVFPFNLIPWPCLPACLASPVRSQVSMTYELRIEKFLQSLLLLRFVYFLNCLYLVSYPCPVSDSNEYQKTPTTTQQIYCLPRVL